MEILDDLWFCTDCTMVAANGDSSGLDCYLEPNEAESRLKDIEAGLAELEKQGHVCCGDDEEEFSHRTCDCCGEDLAGHRQQFILLGK